MDIKNLGIFIECLDIGYYKFQLLPTSKFQPPIYNIRLINNVELILLHLIIYEITLITTTTTKNEDIIASSLHSMDYSLYIGEITDSYPKSWHYSLSSLIFMNNSLFNTEAKLSPTVDDFYNNTLTFLGKKWLLYDGKDMLLRLFPFVSSGKREGKILQLLRDKDYKELIELFGEDINVQAFKNFLIKQLGVKICLKNHLYLQVLFKHIIFGLMKTKMNMWLSKNELIFLKTSGDLYNAIFHKDSQKNGRETVKFLEFNKTKDFLTLNWMFTAWNEFIHFIELKLIETKKLGLIIHHNNKGATYSTSSIIKKWNEIIIITTDYITIQCDIIIISQILLGDKQLPLSYCYQFNDIYLNDKKLFIRFKFSDEEHLTKDIYLESLWNPTTIVPLTLESQPSKILWCSNNGLYSGTPKGFYIGKFDSDYINPLIKLNEYYIISRDVVNLTYFRIGITKPPIFIKQEDIYSYFIKRDKCTYEQVCNDDVLKYDFIYFIFSTSTTTTTRYQYYQTLKYRQDKIKRVIIS